MKLFDWVFGRHLANSEDEDQRIGILAGIPMLGLDALSSCAYGPEAALTVLLPIGALGLHYVMPIIGAILLLLGIVYFSYRQTIAAYPTGGGSYTVAKENLGRSAGSLAAAALLLDYVLTAAVGISAGVGAIISAIPALQNFTLPLCLIILFGITIVNLRGIKESGFVFMIPTYAFVVSVLGVIVYGTIKICLASGNPIPVEAIPVPGAAIPSAVTYWILLRAFASGCTAMTGVEAVSNGVKVFEEPVVPHAQRTLTVIIGILALMLLGIVFISHAYSIGATPPGETGYESMISQMLRAVVGRGFVYYFTIFSVTSVLAFSANTAFADFPRLCQILAKDSLLPGAFAERGRRLVFSHGIITLALLAGGLLILFGGVTDNLIPLYAIGAFLAFTLSQAGMVVHWKKIGMREHWHSVAINFTGAVATGITLVVVLASKFLEGGWITAVLIPIALFLFHRVRLHYAHVGQQLFCREPMVFGGPPPLVIVPMRSWNTIARKALQLASHMSDQVYAVHVESEDISPFDLEKQWGRYVLEPAAKVHVIPPTIVRLKNPYRRLFSSLFLFVDELEKQYPDRTIVIVIPSLVEYTWRSRLLHNQRAVLLMAALYLRRDRKISVVSVPWYLVGPSTR